MKKIIIVLLLFLSYFSYSQNEHKSHSKAAINVDSLITVLNNVKDDTANCRLYLEIGDIYEFANPDTAIYFYVEANNVAEEALSRESSGSVKNTLYEYSATAKLNIGLVYFEKGNYYKATDFYHESLKIYVELSKSKDTVTLIKGKIGVANCYNVLGVVHGDQGNYDQAIDYYLKSIKIREEHNDNDGLSACYNNIGVIHINTGNYDMAIEFFLKALKIFEENGFMKGISDCYTNIGIVYHEQSNFKMAIEYFNKSLSIDEQLNDNNGMAICYTNIGTVYHEQALIDNDEKVISAYFDKATEYYMKSLKISEGIGDIKGIADCYSNIGIIHHDNSNYKEAINYYMKTLKIYEDIGDKYGITLTYVNTSDLYFSLADLAVGKNEKTKHLREAIEYGHKAIKLAREIKALPTENDAAAGLQQAYKAIGEPAEALKYAEIYIATQDSMFSNEKTKALAQMEARYQSEKKQNEIEKLEKQQELDSETIARKEAENKKQEIIILSATIGLIVIFVFSVFLFRMFRAKKKANHILIAQNEEINQKNEEITAQRDEIEAQHELVSLQKEKIDDSLNYAKLIQNAVLPSREQINSILGDHFIIFRPKDIVSGDFYWAAKTEEWTVITVADCTGHGVPGAFMSMLGVSFLNEIVRKKEVTNAAYVLNYLRLSIIEALQQKGDYINRETGQAEIMDGMDMSIIAIHKNKRRGLWAGANNPLWITRQANESTQFEDQADKVEVIKGNSMPVAIHLKMDDFTNHDVRLNEGDKLFLFTDGFPDQFGGEHSKKFLSKNFMILIGETSSLSIQDQGKKIEETLEDWVNYNGQHHEAIDDVTVVGLKI